MKTRNHQKFNFKRIISIAVLQVVLISFSVRVNAQCGSALKFDTTNMSFIWGNSIPEISNNFTYEIWVKPSRSIREGINEVDKRDDAIFNQSYVVFPDYYEPEIDATSAGLSVGYNGIIVAEFAGNFALAALVYYGAISSTEWTHVAVVYKDKRPSLYINGSYVKTGSVTPKSYVHPSPHLGDVSEGYLYGPFGGSVDEYRIWDAVLSAETIANWYKRVVSSNHPNYSDLHLYFPFDDGTGDTTADQSGNENPIYFEHNPEWVNGWQTNFSDAIPECEITSSTNSIYLGYGDQTSKLVASGGHNYKWDGSNLSSYDRDTIIFSPTEGDENYTINLTSKSNYGCISKCEASICVLDITAPGGSTENPKIYICHAAGAGSPKTIAISINSVESHIGKHSGDKLGKCSQECSSTLGKKSKTISGVIYTNAESNLLVYPNPSKGIFNFEMESESSIPISIEIYDYTGKLVIKKMGGVSGSTTTFNLQSFTKGVYFARVSQGRFNKTVKLILD